MTEPRAPDRQMPYEGKRTLEVCQSLPGLPLGAQCGQVIQPPYASGLAIIGFLGLLPALG